MKPGGWDDDERGEIEKKEEENESSLHHFKIKGKFSH